MNEKTVLKQGETLLLLQRKSGKSVAEVAKMLDIHPNHLSKIFKSEVLTAKIRNKASQIFNVSESVFSGNTIASFPQTEVNESPVFDYRRTKGRVGDLTAAEVLQYIEEKDRAFEAERLRHYEERARLLGIIENLTKSK